MAELFKVNAPVRKPLFEGVQGENEARSIQFDITPWVDELGDGAVTATAKRSQDSQPYPVTVTKDGNVVTWKPTSTDTAYAGVGSFQLEYTVDDVLAKTCIWSTMVAPSLDPAGDPPDPYDNWLAEMREIAADAIQAAQDAEDSADDAQAEVYEAEAWAKGTKNGTPVTSSDAQYQNNSKYFAEESYKNAEAWAVGQRGGVDVPSTDPTYENNAKYWAEQSLANQYGAFIVKSASGDIASFNDGADDVPMKSLNVTITPKQSGSGDPSPSNVRPITGWTDADVHVDGKNQIDPEGFILRATYNPTSGTTIPTEASSGATASGTNPITVDVTTGWRGVTFISDELVSGQNYQLMLKVSAQTISSVRVSTYFVDKNNTTVGASYNYTGDSAQNILAPINPTVSGLRLMVAVISTSAQTLTVTDLCLNHDVSGNYYPYTSHTTPVPLGQTVYGGSVDVVEGDGNNNVNIVTINDIAFGTATIGGHNIFRGISYFANSPTAVGMCECLKFTTEGLSTMPNNSFRFSTYWDGNARLAIRADDYATVADLKSALGAYKFAIPVNPYGDFTFDPAQVASLLGTNNVWSDAGSVEVEYRADPTLAYNELANVIVSLGGNL